MTEFEEVKQETVKFLRGKYKLDEIPYKNHEIKFRQGAKTIVSVTVEETKLKFLLVFGKYEREKFENTRNEFSSTVQSIYDNSKTYHDGKWMDFEVDSLEYLEEVKKLILIKKKPNRKPLPKDGVVYGKCGHRCDMCVHYTESTKEYKEMLIPHLINVYQATDWSLKCTGCDTPGCQCHTVNEVCEPILCVARKNLQNCMECKEYPCKESTVGFKDFSSHAITADDVTYAILPYVPHQYED